MDNIHPVFNIDNYICDGFQHVADVVCHPNLEWSFCRANFDLLFSPHDSNVYLITQGKRLVRIGESGLPLGIRHSGELNQPVPNSSCRLGGYRRGTSMLFVREALKDFTDVSIWAMQCEIKEQRVIIGGRERIFKSTYHKELEKFLLEKCINLSGSIPPLNPIKK